MDEKSDVTNTSKKNEIKQNRETEKIMEEDDDLGLELRQRLHSRTLPPMDALVYENFFELCSQFCQPAARRRFFTWRKVAAIFLVVFVVLGIAGRQRPSSQTISAEEQAELPQFLSQVAQDMVQDPSFPIVSAFSSKRGFWREFLPEGMGLETSKKKDIQEYWDETSSKMHDFLYRGVDGSRQ